MGYQNAFILAAFAGLAQVLSFLVVVKWGKSWRRMTKKRFYKFVKEIKFWALLNRRYTYNRIV